ncbi:MAG TPA: carboxypeptidase regulatory-like domain-containing protein, partial [Chitinophagaceae bacterium]|nr:carboxypeptidase regulatory-like domain-containing protein [Chitinophagaceae bacterium]
MKTLALFFFSFFFTGILYAQPTLSISGTVRLGNEPAPQATVSLEPGHLQKITTDNGYFRFAKLLPGQYQVTVSMIGYIPYTDSISLSDKNSTLDINLTAINAVALATVTVSGNKNESVSGKLKDVSGTAIYAGKKTELINLKNINANLATNNTRQIYARIPGLNIWEYDRGGLQLGIGGRGLSPNRSSNFNIRQNGYDISADALGYPES